MTFFELVLTDLTKFVPDCIEEYLRFFKTILEEGFEFYSSDGHNSAVFNLLLILLLVV